MVILIAIRGCLWLQKGLSRLIGFFRCFHVKTNWKNNFGIFKTRTLIFHSSEVIKEYCSQQQVVYHNKWISFATVDDLLSSVYKSMNDMSPALLKTKNKIKINPSVHGLFGSWPSVRVWPARPNYVWFILEFKVY